MTFKDFSRTLWTPYGLQVDSVHHQRPA